MSEWVKACCADDIDDEDVIGFRHNDIEYAIYNSPKGFYATHGICTHEVAKLEEDFLLLRLLHQRTF